MRFRGFILSGLLAVAVFAQTAITNDSIIKMVKAGLGDDLVLSTIKAQPAKFTTSTDDLIALKGAGVSDKVIGAMIERMSAPAAPATPAVSAMAPAGGGLVSEVGLYYKKGGEWTDLPPEVVDFKTGGVLKSIGTMGIVKGDINGHINGEHSRTGLKSPVDILIYTPEGVAVEEYQFLLLHDSKDGREFRTVTGGVMHVSGGATRDLVPFESKKLAPRTYEIILPNLGSGDYGFLSPAGSDSSGSSGRIGKIYSFRIIE